MRRGVRKDRSSWTSGDPGLPVVIATHAPPLGHEAKQVLVAGDHLVAGLTYKTSYFDISEPAFPVHLRDSFGIGQGRGCLSGDFSQFYSDGRLRRQFDRVYESGGNVGQSIRLNDFDLTVVAARINTVQDGSIRWDVSATGGAQWIYVQPGEDWYYFFQWPGTEVAWKATLQRSARLAEPTTCDMLDLEWLYFEPVIDTVTDIPGDEGRQVRVSWVRSGFDTYRISPEVSEYAVYRRWDGAGVPRRPAADAPLRAAALPPGDWDFVASVPATGDDRYSIVVPTVLDSTIVDGLRLSTFFVSAMTDTPGQFYDSPTDSGYSVDNLAPSVPMNLAVTYSSDENQMSWDESTDDDFMRFRVYRRDIYGSIQPPGELISETTGTAWSDFTPDAWKYTYWVSAVDFSGNESPLAGASSTTGTKPVATPRRVTLGPVVPIRSIRTPTSSTWWRKLAWFASTSTMWAEGSSPHR